MSTNNCLCVSCRIFFASNSVLECLSVQGYVSPTLPVKFVTCSTAICPAGSIACLRFCLTHVSCGSLGLYWLLHEVTLGVKRFL